MLHQQYDKIVSLSTIARKLEGHLITLKKLELLPERRNGQENKELRRQHAEWIQREHEQGARVCYVDEYGFDLYAARTKGRSVRDLPARRITGNQRQPHITLLCAISPGRGLIHSMTIVGGAKQEQFDQFIQELAGRDLIPALASFLSWRGATTVHYF
jgi:hypothetical protein